jgi:hypothetical protein
MSVNRKRKMVEALDIDPKMEISKGKDLQEFAEESNSVVEAAINVPLPMEVTDNEIGDHKVIGIRDSIVVSVVFNVVAMTEVTIENPLGKVPSLYRLVNLLPDTHGAATRPYDVLKSSDTWNADNLGFKCTADTHTTPLTVLIEIA